MAKVTRSVELHLALIWAHSTETFLQVVLEFVTEFEFEVQILIEPRYPRTCPNGRPHVTDYRKANLFFQLKGYHAEISNRG